MKGLRKILLAAAALMMAVSTINAQKYRINGYVLDENGGLPNVNIIDQKGKWVGQADANGRFDIQTSTDTVVFTFIGCQPQKIATAQGRNVVIQMTQNVNLKEVTVEAKLKGETIGRIPPVAKGNWMPYNLPVIMPKSLIHGNYRFVMQPRLTDMTTGKTIIMKPLVIDGRKYNDTQHRLYDQDISRDPLGGFIVLKPHPDKGRVAVNYSDTVYVDHPRNILSLTIYKSLEDYSHVIKIDTLKDYIRGSVNPLKLLNFNIAAKQISDSAYFPKPNRQFMDTEGNLSLHYLIGKAQLDLNDETTKKELERVTEELRLLESDNTVTLQSFAIKGTASPDGPYQSNLKLAGERMNNARNYFVNRLDPKTRALIELKSSVSVAPWEDILPMLKADSLFTLSKEIEAVLAREKNISRAWLSIRKLKGYDIISKKYLPRLRTSHYRYTYSVFRNRNIDEIRAAYAAHKTLSPFEYWKLYNEEPDAGKKEKYCREALQKYPDFLMAANDITVMTSQKNKADASALEPFMKRRDLPNEVKINYLIALLQNDRYSEAYALQDKPMGNSYDAKLIRAFVRALNNDIKPEDRKIIEQTDTLNKVLLDLNEGKQKEALTTILPMEDLDGRGWYIKAICCNRNNMPAMARDCLEKAIKADKIYDVMAQTDADIYEVYKSLKHIDK